MEADDADTTSSPCQTRQRLLWTRPALFWRAGPSRLGVFEQWWLFLEQKCRWLESSFRVITVVWVYTWPCLLSSSLRYCTHTAEEAEPLCFRKKPHFVSDFRVGPEAFYLSLCLSGAGLAFGHVSGHLTSSAGRLNGPHIWLNDKSGFIWQCWIEEVHECVAKDWNFLKDTYLR